MSDPAISIRGLSRHFGRTCALENIDLDVPAGGVFGLVGENGAGKTTLLKHILGLLKAQSGTVHVFGRNPVEEPAEVLGDIGFLSEAREMPNWMRIDEMIKFKSAFYPNWDQAYADELCDMFALDKQQRVKTLSRGQLARAGLLLAIAHRPPLLILDEPSSGLDAVVRRDILAAIIRTVADEGRTVLFSSHLLDEVERVADRVAIMNNGRIVMDDQLDVILGEHARFVVRFDESQLTPPALDGAISCTGSGQEWTVLCNGHKDEVRKQLADQQATIVEQRAASLEDIFVGYVGRKPNVHESSKATPSVER